MRTWAKGFDAVPVPGGEVINVYDKLGTITIPNKEIPVYLYGILLGLTIQISTAGQTLDIEVEINSSDLGLYQERFHLKTNQSDPIGTNTQWVIVKSEFLPVLLRGKTNNKKIDVHISVSATVTGLIDGYCSAIFGDIAPDALPEDYKQELMMGYESKVRSLGRIEQDAALAHGTANADVTDTAIPIPSKASELVGLIGNLSPNAPTASEEVASQFTFESGSISDFAPQEYPGALSYIPTLGTVVGGAASGEKRYYPVRFPLPQTNFDMTVKSRNILALTTAPNTQQGAKFRTPVPAVG